MFSKRWYHVLLLTPTQINRLDMAQMEGRRTQLCTSARQVAKNISYTGSFLCMLASLAARAITLTARAVPTILTGLTTTGLLSGGINKAILGEGFYLHKHDKCYQVQKCKGDGLCLAPHPRFVEGGGLFLKHGNDINDGAALLMGKNSPFKNILILGWL